MRICRRFNPRHVVPGGIYRRSGLPVGPDGALAVNEHLQALGLPEIFGGGDGIWFTPRSLPRAGVFAVREGPILLHNVSIALGARGQMRRFRPQRSHDVPPRSWHPIRVCGAHLVAA